MESSVEVISQLKSIKWLLIVLVLSVGLFVLLFFRIMARLGSMTGTIKENAEYQKFQRRCEDLLMQGSWESVVNSAKERISTYPFDVYAHWYLAQALFKKGSLIEAKRTFQRIAELDPSWEGRASCWLERVEDKLKASGPKIIG